MILETLYLYNKRGAARPSPSGCRLSVDGIVEKDDDYCTIQMMVIIQVKRHGPDATSGLDSGRPRARQKRGALCWRAVQKDFFASAAEKIFGQHCKEDYSLLRHLFCVCC